MQRTPWNKVITAGLVAPLLAFGPGSQAAASGPLDVNGATSGSGRSATSADDPLAAAIAANGPYHGNDADQAWVPDDVVSVILTGAGAVVRGGDGVTVKKSVVTVIAPGTYRFRGILTDGQVVVDAPNTGYVRLILDGVDITSTTTAPLLVENATRTIVLSADGSKNTLSHLPGEEPPDDPEDPNDPGTPGDPNDPGTPGDPNDPNGQAGSRSAATHRVGDQATEPLADNAKAALLSRADLTIGGRGTLDITGDRDGVSSTKGLIIEEGAIRVKAADDGIRGKDYVVFNGGTTTVTADGDGVRATNDEDPKLGYILSQGGAVTVDAQRDGLSAATDVLAESGTLSVRSGGGSTATLPDDVSAKGIKSEVSILIGPMNVSVNSADSAVHCDGDVKITNGTMSLASGNEGVHGGGRVDISGGKINVTNAYEIIEALKLTISGGTVTGTASNDGLNAKEEGVDEFQTAPNAFVHIDGGSINIKAGDDGIDSNGTMVVTGGTTVIVPDYDGIDTNGTMTMTGGTIVINGAPSASGGQNALEVLSGLTLSGGKMLCAAASVAWTLPVKTSTQGWVLFRSPKSQPAGTVLQLVSGEKVIAAYQASRNFQSMIFSSDLITTGETYDVYIGGSTLGTAVGGMYPEGDLTDATLVATVTAGKA